ncbi:MAG: hypothetical protein FJ278_14710 [Planctomycetes bacterium]|nr:hypothetical protein [Planctomycetota bacterium]
MSVPQKALRGLRDIRTIQGRGITPPHEAYMRIAYLELEKFRRAKERDSALLRVATINSRLRKIEDEKAALSQSVGEEFRVSAPRAAGEKSPRSSRSASSTFKLRY